MKLLEKLKAWSEKRQVKSAKKAASKKNEPWIHVVKTTFDPKNPKEGFFELDWNDQFIKALVDAGYNGVTDDQIVEQWFEDLCKQVVYNNYEEVAESTGTTFIQRKILDGGRSEVS